MTTTKAHTRATGTMDAARDAGDEIADETRTRAGQVRVAVEDAVDHVPEVLESARAGAERVAERLPDAAERARLGVEETTTTLQTLPDQTLRLLVAASIGLARGLHPRRGTPPRDPRVHRARAPRRRSHGHPSGVHPGQRALTPRTSRGATTAGIDDSDGFVDGHRPRPHRRQRRC